MGHKKKQKAPWQVSLYTMEHLCGIVDETNCWDFHLSQHVAI